MLKFSRIAVNRATMTFDSEPIKITKTPDAIGSVFIDILTCINYKTLLFIMFMFVILNSDVFISRILTNINGAVDGKIATNMGVIIQSILLGASYIIMDGLVRNDVV